MTLTIEICLFFKPSRTDDRKNGTGIDIDVEVVDGKERGVGILKLYGPNSKKKENVIMVSKSKDSEHKFVIILTEKVIKPLMDKFLVGEKQTETIVEANVMSSVSDEEETLACKFCGKMCVSSAGLKGKRE